MKSTLLTIILFLCCLCTFSRHIKGGFFTYQYLGPGTSNTAYLKYKVTLTVYMSCGAEGNQVDESVHFTIFNGSSSSQYSNIVVQRSSVYDLRKNYDEPCISERQDICYYKIVTYVLPSIELPVSANGYTISYQRCCRIENMDNIVNSGNVGNTYTIQIPGSSSPVPDAVKNSSPLFPINDTAVICENGPFTYPFSATDADGDSLSYEFCTSYSGGGQNMPAPENASAPPYSSVPYYSTFNGSSPMGSQVTINAKTGLISGIAPSIRNVGEFAVTVCVSEFRKGVFIALTRKELHISVKDCTLTNALLNPKPTTCDGYAVSFKNDVPNEPGTEYLWTFGDFETGTLDTSRLATPVHTYGDTGVYVVKLRVSLNGLCADSTTLPVKVYPGFFPGFVAAAPLCKGQPVTFRDTTKTNYGVPTGWQWNFGDASSIADTSSNFAQPVYNYPDSGTYSVRLIVGNTFGCIDTITRDVVIRNSPNINLVPHDTLICYIDTLQITTNNTGSFAWSPNYNINSLTSANPLVSPDVTTTYTVNFTDRFGCKNVDSVKVNVVRFVTLDAGKDSTICRTDGLVLSPASNALHYVWTPATYLDNDSIKNPLANPLVPSINYHVVASIGKCQNTSDVTIKTLPYPAAYAGRDTTVCFSTPAFLKASGGISYQWSPATFLSTTNAASTIAVRPTATTRYIVAVRDTVGCLKPAFDTMVVNVDPFMPVDAGPSDTTVVLGEPMYLTGAGGATYLWQPSTYLSNPTIANPIADIEGDITYRLLATSAAGCQKTDTIRIKFYKVPPSFYVPSAFSPNGDNNNDVLKPILLGMRTLDYFMVYDRWGKLLFSTKEKGRGWDGTLNGNPQDPGTYVWMAAGATYTGEAIVRKGYTVLVR